MKSVEITEEMKAWTIKGRFVREDKYRFHCYVEIDGAQKLCYVPSNCKLEKIISLAGREVILKKYDGPSNKYEYIVEAVKYGNSLVLLNLQFLNRIIENQIQRRIFNYLGERKYIRREVTVEDYKADLYIADTQTYIEIKSILSWNKCASYPIDSSDRGLEQLEKIEKLLDQNKRIFYFLFSMSPNVQEIIIDSNSLYGTVLNRCISKGLILRAYSLGGSNNIEVKKEIVVCIQ